MKYLVLLICAVAIGGCASVSVPDVKGLTEMPEFAEEAKNITDYPDITEAPEYPDDVKGDSYWDNMAKRIIRKRDGVQTPGDPHGNKSDAQLERDYQALQAKAREYKLDDPQ